MDNAKEIEELRNDVVRARRGVRHLENQLRRRQAGSSGHAETAQQLEARRAKLDAAVRRLDAATAISRGYPEWPRRR